MSNSPYPSSSESSLDKPPLESSNATKYAELDRTVQNIRIENTRLHSDVQQLRGRTATLVGLLVGLTLLMIGGFSWLVISLQNFEKEEQQISNGVDPAISSQVEKLEEQVNDLSKNVPGNLTDTLQSNQTALTQLQTQLQEVTVQIKALERSSSNVQPKANVSPQVPSSSDQQSSESPKPKNSP